MLLKPKSSDDINAALPQRVLFLSAQVGTGHMSAALAVQHAMSELQPSTDSLLVDTYDYANRLFGKMATKGYLQLVKFLPQIYNFFYESRQNDPAIAVLKSKFTQITAHNLKPLIKSFSPHVIVSTHAFSSGVASCIKNDLGVPIVNIVTDFTIHPFWIHPNVDLYLVANEQLIQFLMKRGIPQDKIKITGIPVDSDFCIQRTQKRELRKKLGLVPNLDAVLLMGGGVGLGPMGWTLRSLKKIKHPIQVVVITGTNLGLKKRMEQYASKFNNHEKNNNAVKLVKVYGYVNNVHEFMRASDLLISKPGGLTTSEALVAELPLLITGPLPGPETRNAQYLLKEKTAVVVRRIRNIAKDVDLLFSEKQRLKKLRERAHALKKPDAAYDAARSILALTNQKGIPITV